MVVDAIFGTGFTGAAKGVEAAAIGASTRPPRRRSEHRHRQRRRREHRHGAGPAVEADLTVALHAPKVGHFVTPGGAFSGEVVIAPIGIPPICDRAPEAWLLTAAAVADLHPAQRQPGPQAVGGHGHGRRRLRAA